MENARQGLVAEFRPEGTAVRSHGVRWGMETRGCGYGDALHRLPAVTPTASANRVEYRRDGLTEWYKNGPLGLEQGFTLAHRPGGRKRAADAGIGTDRNSSAGARAVLRYTGMEAHDATGRPLPSWLELPGERLLLRVEDKGSRYPVVVDPWVQEAELTDGAAGDGFGISVAISGNTTVVGAHYHSGGGAAYVFVESGGTWSQQAALTPSDSASANMFGSSIAISGNTVVVADPGHKVGSNGYEGAAYVFVESGGTWSQEAELTASDGNANDEFGDSVAVSRSTAVVGSSQHTVASKPSRERPTFLLKAAERGVSRRS